MKKYFTFIVFMTLAVALIESNFGYAGSTHVRDEVSVENIQIVIGDPLQSRYVREEIRPISLLVSGSATALGVLLKYENAHPRRIVARSCGEGSRCTEEVVDLFFIRGKFYKGRIQYSANGESWVDIDKQKGLLGESIEKSLRAIVESVDVDALEELEGMSDFSDLVVELQIY